MVAHAPTRLPRNGRGRGKHLACAVLGDFCLKHFAGGNVSQRFNLLPPIILYGFAESSYRMKSYFLFPAKHTNSFLAAQTLPDELFGLDATPTFRILPGTVVSD
jgi:hypothetical protein